jgi:hypothetical protein
VVAKSILPSRDVFLVSVDSVDRIGTQELANTSIIPTVLKNVE